MRKERIIIFGASKGGERFLRRCGSGYGITAFCDNDPAKQGNQICSIPIIAPAQINEHSYDYILIASMFGFDIKRQLIDEYGIPSSMIRFAPKSALSPNKTYRPFEHEETRKLARSMLVLMTNILDENHIPYFLDHGTLLGLVREGDLLSWDDDLDISVPCEYSQKSVNMILESIASLPHSDSLKWMAENVIDIDKDRIMGINICYHELNPIGLRKFAFSIWFMFEEGTNIRQYINQAPKHFFSKSDSLPFFGKEFTVPQRVDEYLSFHYGNWQEPVKDMSLEEIQNYCPPPTNIRRDVIFGEPDLF